MYRKFIVIILICLSVNSISLSQIQSENAGANREFKLALTFYQSENLNEALKLFDDIINSRQNNSDITPAFVFKGKILLKQKKYFEATSILNQFLNIYPSSKYSDEARIVITKVYVEQNNYLSAFEELNQIITTTKSPAYLTKAKLLGEKIALNYLKINQLESLYNSTESVKLKPYLLLLTGKYNLYNGSVNNGISIFKQIISTYPLSQESIEAQNLFDSISKNKNITSADALVGVILPLFNNDKNIQGSSAVNEILEGIKFAFSQYNRSHKGKIGLIIRDSQRSRKTIEEIANQFEGIPGLNIVIGPIFSDEVLEAGNAFKGSQIKIISPTATDNGITEINKNVYQANPSFAVRGKTMADYVYFIEKKSKIGVISSNSGYSKDLALAFINEFKKIGGKILDYETYQANSITISSQVNRLNFYRNELEGIYAPISEKNDAPVILSSLVLDSLYVQMYGNQDWYGANGMETSSALSSNFILSSDYYIDFNNPDYNNLSKMFAEQTGGDVNRNVLYGYDLAKYLLDILSQSNNEINKIGLLLNADKTGKGYHNDYQFDEKNVNKYLNIIRYQNGNYMFLERFKAIN